jgi:hypothetical protein
MCHVWNRIAGRIPTRRITINNLGVRASQNRRRAVGEMETASYQRYGIGFIDAVDMEKQLFDHM